MLENIETLKNLVDYGVIVLLVIMSFIAVFFFIERVLFYKKIDLKEYKKSFRYCFNETPNYNWNYCFKCSIYWTTWNCFVL